MKIVVCGASNVAKELLKRLGEQWQVTLVDKTEITLGDFSKDFQSVVKVVSGDASSPVILEEAGIEDQDYALALTDDDRINLAVVSHAAEKNVKNLMSLVHDPERLSEFTDLGAWTFPLTSFVARMIYRYLQDPRMNVLPVGQGQAEFLEIEISQTFMAAGKEIRDFQKPDRRIVGLLRDGQLMFPNAHTRLAINDRLLVLGKPDLVKDVCTEFECGQPSFPLMYGQTLVLAIPLEEGRAGKQLLNEAFYLANKTKTHRIVMLSEPGACGFKDDVNRWSETLDIEMVESEDRVTEQIRDVATRENLGVVVIPPMKGSFLKSIKKPRVISIAHSLECPLMIARGTSPYEGILVPFDGSAKAERALEAAIDLSQQLDARLAAVVVEEPGFLHGETRANPKGVEEIWKRVRELGHIHKLDIEEIAMAGNPVKEISKAAANFGLLVLSSTSEDKGLLSPNVGENLTEEVSCSVLIVTN